MTKQLLFSLVALALIAAPAPALAQATATDATTTPGYRFGQPFQDVRREYEERRRDLLEQYKAERDEVKDQAQEERQRLNEVNRLATTTPAREQVRQERHEQLSVLKQERIKLYARRIVDRLNTALDRSRLFIDRINALLARWEEQGKETADVSTILGEAEILIADGQNKIDAIMPAVENLLTSTTTSTSTNSTLAEVKILTQEAITAIKAAHAKVVEAVRTLKVIGGNNDDEDDETDDDETATTTLPDGEAGATSTDN
jgi:DNA repair exonuclease SbcCD ATPase subunit